MARVITREDALPFVADPASMDFNMGKEIDWDNVTAKTIPAGTIMCELTGGKICPVAEAPGVETATGLLVASVSEDDQIGGLGYGVYVGGVVFANLLPDAGDGSFATWQGELNAAGVGHFVWLTYADDRT